jgi:predicted DNA binding protein
VVELPQQADVRGLVERFESEYDGVELLAKRETERSGWTAHELREVLETRLTDRQLEVIETAYEAGYFEWPRGSSGQDVAEMLDITQPTFNRHMRRAERVTFSLLLG